MKLKDLKEWVNSVPEEFEDTEIVFREAGDLVDDTWYAKDTNIAAVGIDEISGETYFLSQESAMKIKEKQGEE